MMPVLFITDALFLFLILMFAGFVVYARRHEHIIEPWRHVAKRPMAMASAVVLLFYLGIAVLDSIHFHPKLDGESDEYSTEIISVLDLATTHIRERLEKTYSAPFAMHAYSKETIEATDGSQIRDFPRLLYGGQHLASKENHVTDIALKSMFGVGTGVLIIVLCVFVIALTTGKNVLSLLKACVGCKMSETCELPARAILMTFTMLIILFSWAFYISFYYHILGTDKVGQDVFYQALKSIRTGLLIGTLTTLVMLPFALLLGIMAGYFRGWIDDVIQYLYTTLNSIPGVLLIAASVLMLDVYMSNHSAEFTSTAHRSDLRLLFLCIILGIMSWTGLCRMLRGEVMKLREIEYVQAAQAFGVNSFTIMLRHLLPNVMHIIMISIVLDFSGLVLAEAVLAYINIGVDPSMISWGNMINSARLEMAREPMVWWSLLAAFVFMLGLVLAANLFSDAVRDAYDPRIRESKG